ncbi:MAG: histidine phosphatase family protein [Pseudomonadota bacterium]
MREKEAATRIIYVRHGLTDFPTNRIYCDDLEDPALNERGLRHARDAAALLAQQAVDVIYASPSCRTRMTADEIAKATGAGIVDMAALRERRFGIWDGLYFNDIEQRYPDEYQAWKRDLAGYTPQGGETMETLLQRAGSAITQIVRAHPNQTVVVVSHVGPIRVCMAEALKIPLAWYRQLHIDYGSLTRVDYGRSQNNIIYTNLARAHFQS